jgi:hypothetical protein
VQTDMGGAGAPLTVQSVAAMRATLAGITPDHKGAFLNYDGQPFGAW